MSITMKRDIKCWTAKRKNVLVHEPVQRMGGSGWLDPPRTSTDSSVWHAWPRPQSVLLRSDNGLVFTFRHYTVLV